MLDGVVAGIAPQLRRHRAGVALADAFLLSPSQVPEQDWATIREELSPAEAADAVLRMGQHSRNKVRVALGLDDDEITPRSL